jgi:hypothetical protein
LPKWTDDLFKDAKTDAFFREELGSWKTGCALIPHD